MMKMAVEPAAEESLYRCPGGRRFWDAASPAVLTVLSLLVGLFFMRPNMGEPDSYREALSALQYIEKGTYGSYWDHPLTLYIFVAATRLALLLNTSHVAVLNTVAVLFGAASIWPFYNISRKFVSLEAAALASFALILSPAFVRFSTYLSHETVGFSFALWSLYFFQLALAKRIRLAALAFGLCFAATWAARPNAAIFLAPPLAILLIHDVKSLSFAAAARLFVFAGLGLVICLAMVYRPALVLHLASRPGSFFFTYYDFGRYTKSTTELALRAITAPLACFSVLGFILLLACRKFLLVLFAGAWILTVYAFYTGMYSMERYFLILLPPCLLISFAGFDALGSRLPMKSAAALHGVKIGLMVGLFAGLVAPAVAFHFDDLFYVRNVNDDEIASREIGRIVGRELLFTTSPEPMIRYYNRDGPPQTMYLMTEQSPGKVAVRLDAFRLAQSRLKEGRPVFATGEIVRNLQALGIEAEFVPVWEYKSLVLHRLRSLNPKQAGQQQNGAT
ncbi:MAG: hypothetical protein C4532_07600 [Candidatus Abyssobacteria bacterium SURF_17]|uniref:Glycosyltransferase RgtA/B/C/D-like domain-containing protein n=1 Tax=Candidatus Abyssobacteria bacterium SURF_17 TaxID=2093361 RepID=A0A419F0F6_9BACT|nr:MAG: hypothetical protein C4532_07600 [Candidatus Abyssubacteria bacterium SURF_17]